MAYRLVKGEFHLFYRSIDRLVGSSPDGDSVWFKPASPNLLQNLGGRNAKLNGGGFAQLRFEGIDSLELHYKGSNHQKRAETVAARDHLLEEMGFAQITYAPSTATDIDTRVRTAQPHPRTGYILTRNIDPFGRPVAFAFAGTTQRADGGDVFLGVAELNRSLNAELMRTGLAYPGFYTGLPSDLRDRLTDLAIAAWNADDGVWAVDQSGGARVRNANDLETLAIWPKLYRRLLAFFADGHVAVGQFDAWLRADDARDDALWIISEAHLGNLHDAVKVTGDRIAMQFEPEDLIIVPR